MKPKRAPNLRNFGGFTLVELLVVIGIIAVLVGALLPALAGARQQARAVREVAAARQLIQAFYMYANDNRGRVLPGYYNGPAEDELGNVVPFPVNARYPWRLMRYLNKTLRGAVLVNDQDERLGQRDLADVTGWSYSVSVFPSFGMNAAGVGGNLISGSTAHVRRLGEPRNATELIVFASSRFNASGYHAGYHEVARPTVSVFNPSAPAYLFGYVDPRWKGRAAAAFFDGHAGLLDARELTDPRHWTKKQILP